MFKLVQNDKKTSSQKQISFLIQYYSFFSHCTRDPIQLLFLLFHSKHLDITANIGSKFHFWKMNPIQVEFAFKNVDFFDLKKAWDRHLERNSEMDLFSKMNPDTSLEIPKSPCWFLLGDMILIPIFRVK